MTAEYWKLDVDHEVAAGDPSSHLGNGPFLILRVDTRGKKTTIHFEGHGDEVARLQIKAVATKLEDVTKF